jgi:hypothetical protein
MLEARHGAGWNRKIFDRGDMQDCYLGRLFKGRWIVGAD